jgi:hypothetical protein
VLDILHILSNLWQQLQATSSGVALIAVLASVVGYVISSLQSLRADNKELKRLAFQQDTLLVQRRRLNEHNLSVETSAELVYHHEGSLVDGKYTPGKAAEPYVAAKLELGNTGDGPMDLLACMVAGRELTNARVRGMGLWGRDVEWDDLQRYFWNDSIPALARSTDPSEGGVAAGDEAASPLFTGISTTKDAPYSRDQLIRLDPGQYEVLDRIDALGLPLPDGLKPLFQKGHINLVYKVFTVVLGYPLAVIDQQIGIGPRRRASSTDLAKLYALDLARPDFRRWGRVQRALETVNRLAFRLALVGLEREQEEAEKKQEEAEKRKKKNYYAADPLGRLAYPTPWRCFLLYHWDFDETGDAAPRGALNPVLDPFGDERRKNDRVPTVEEVSQYVRDEYGVYDPDLTSDENWAKAVQYCRKQLDPLVRAWISLNQVIDYCDQREVGFKNLITDKPYKESKGRWEALEQEGYLLTRVMDSKLQPEDPMALERYHIGTKYVLVTLRAPGHRLREHEQAIRPSGE